MNKLSLAKYFTGRVENIAYSKMNQGGLNVKNDGAISKQELSVAYYSCKLSANEMKLALSLAPQFKTVIGTSVHTPTSNSGNAAFKSKISHQDLVGTMSQPKMSSEWQKLANSLNGTLRAKA